MSTKTTKIIYWVSTILIFLTQGVMPLLTFNDPDSKNAMKQLGYPEYFGLMLAIFKILGALVLVLPFVKGRLKEWAYAGFTFDFLSAFISMWAAFGISNMLLIPWVFIAVLAVSYFTYHKLLNTGIAGR